MTFRVAHCADTHLGYAAGSRTHKAGDVETGLNERVVDGYKAVREIITQIIAAKPDLVVHGGDVFHTSWPDILSVRFAQEQLLRLHRAGIPVVILIGNHDAPSEKGKAAGPLVLHDPARGIQVVSAHSEVLRPVPGLALHALTHMGLASREVPDLTPVDGEVSIFAAHGAAAIPGTPLFHCSHSPNEQPLGPDLIGLPWHAGMLGHYHGMGPLPGYPHMVYSGSAIPRGFSDPQGVKYGWVEWQISEKNASFTQHAVAQRPVVDLPKIDAAGLTGEDVTERVRANLESVDPSGAIIRQTVWNLTAHIERGVDRAALSKLAGPALSWKFDPRRPEKVEATADGDDGQAVAISRHVGLAELPDRFGEFVAASADELGVPEAHRDDVIERGKRHLRAAAPVVEDVA